MGLYAQEVLDRMTGMADTSGVILLTSPHVPSRQITANGVHADNHSETLVIDTLAMRISADTASWSLIPVIQSTFAFNNVRSIVIHNQGPDLYAFIGFIGPDDDDLNRLLILIFDY